MVVSSVCRAQLQPPATSLLTAPRQLCLSWLGKPQCHLGIQRRSLWTPRTLQRWNSRSHRTPAGTHPRRVGSLHGAEVAPSHDIFSSRGGYPGVLPGAESLQQQGWDFSKLQGSQTAAAHDPYVIRKLVDAPERVFRLEPTTLAPAEELVRHLDTAIRVGKVERAWSIMERVASIHEQDLDIAVTAIEIFFDGLSDLVRRHPATSPQTKQAFRHMNRYFKIHCGTSSQRPTITAPVVTAFVRSALHALAGQDQRSAVQRAFADVESRGDDLYDEALFSESYTDAEYDMVQAIMSEASAKRGADLPLAAEVIAEENLTECASVAKDADVVSVSSTNNIDVDSLDQVLATPTSGLGLQAVQESMTALREMAPLPSDASIEEQKQRNITRQKILEEAAVEIAMKRWQAEDEQLRKIGIHTAMQTKTMGALMWQWYSALLPELEAELKACQQVDSVLNPADDLKTDRQHYGMYLELLPLSKIAANTIIYTCNKMASGSRGTEPSEHRVTSLCGGIAKQIEAEAALIASTKQRRAAARQISKSRRVPQQTTTGGRTMHIEEAKAEVISAWPKIVRLKLGGMLLKKLIETAKLPVTAKNPRTKERVTQMQPAFINRMKYDKGRKIGVLTSNPAYLDKLQSEPLPSLLAKRMPMLVEPRPWTGFSEGGYLCYPSDIMRTLNPADGCRDHFVAAEKRGDLGQLFAGLNALSQVPWRINPDIFKTQLEAWNSGKEIANIAPLNAQYPAPPAPGADAGPEARRKWLAQVRDIENKKTGNLSVRCFQNFQMEVARSMLNETIYLPHNVDFRGRAYPIPPYLNHMGADNARGLLIFAKGKELGERGLRWLKIHLANVSGYDKASLQEREDYTMQHLEDILDSARDPLGGRCWWLKAEDAWQTLAACFELSKALACPDPTKFVSHLPVHQDGTCNGLQHYAALGGDKSGAMHVNLEPGERPADIYSGVMKGVAEAIERDAANDHPIAKLLAGKITRKVVKQPVMTNVYGVTFYGARAQVQKQLEELFPHIGKFDDMNHSKMAAYVVVKIFDMLGSMFTGAQAIQEWLEVCADQITTALLPDQIEQVLARHASKKAPKGSASEKEAFIKAENRALARLFKSTVVWTTPLRLPVVQPYRAGSSKAVRTAVHQLTITEPQLWDPVNRRKQLQAFPPNFIHSLDATHMLMSATKCAEAGLTFASVHDSFWTHACDITEMSTVLREAFITMHQENIVGRLREEFVMRHKGSMCYANLPISDVVAKEIHKWRTKNKHDNQDVFELKVEVERQQLLNSEDSEKRLQGLQMTTPASILEKHEDEHGATYVPLGTKKMTSHLHDAEGLEDQDAESSQQRAKRTRLWRPINFPPVPERGDFDVARLRDSKYFFH